MILESLMTIMSSSGVGAITGGFFGWLNRREDRKTREKDQAFELSRMDKQAAIEVQSLEAEAFTESQKTLSKFADAVKSLVRPVITGFLLWMVYGIFIQLETLTGGLGTLPADEIASLYRVIVLNIISLTATAVSWWFASRPTGINVSREGK